MGEFKILGKDTTYPIIDIQSYRTWGSVSWGAFKASQTPILTFGMTGCLGLVNEIVSQKVKGFQNIFETILRWFGKSRSPGNSAGDLFGMVK